MPLGLLCSKGSCVEGRSTLLTDNISTACAYRKVCAAEWLYLARLYCVKWDTGKDFWWSIAIALSLGTRAEISV